MGIDFCLPGRSDDVSWKNRQKERNTIFYSKDLGGNTIWEDSETKQFYEDIPDLKLFLPGYAFREPVTPAATTTPEGCWISWIFSILFLCFQWI